MSVKREDVVEVGENGRPIIHSADGRKIIQTANLPGFTARPDEKEKSFRPAAGPFVQVTDLDAENRMKAQTDTAYCLENATAADFAELGAKVQKRIEALPQYRYFRCPACGWTQKVGVKTLKGRPRLMRIPEPMTCVSCNPPWRVSYDPGKSIMRELSAKDAAKWEKDQAEKFAAAVAKDKADRERFKDIEEYETRKLGGRG